MNLLVTGGAGFIGTHLCHALIKAGHRVTVLDLAKPTNVVEGVTYVQGDIRNARDMAGAVQGVDAVFHFAAVVSVQLCQEQPVEGYKTNVMGTCEVLEAIRNEMSRTGKKIRIVFSGSSVVYGDVGAEGTPIQESTTAPKPLSFYGAQKLASEHAIRLYFETYGVPGVIFRFFNVYGPGQDPRSPYSGVISIFSSRVAQGQSLRLNGGGKQTRDFFSVYDVCRAGLLALEAPVDSCDAVPINLGSSQSISVRQLAETMLEVSGRRVELVDGPWREGDIMHSRASIERAERVLGWKPSVDLKTGLAEILR